MVLGLKCQRLRSQGHKVQKHIEGDRVAEQCLEEEITNSP